MCRWFARNFSLATCSCEPCDEASFTRRSRADWLRDYLLVQLIRTGTNELSSAEFVVKVCDNPPRTIIDDEDAVPDEYKQEETVISIKKAELRSAMLDGEIIPGAHLEKGKRLKFS